MQDSKMEVETRKRRVFLFVLFFKNADNGFAKTRIIISIPRTESKGPVRAQSGAHNGFWQDKYGVHS